MNADAEPQSGGASTSQCIPYYIGHSGNGEIGTDELDHERHAGATQDASSGSNKPNKVKEEIMLLELLKQLYSRE